MTDIVPRGHFLTNSEGKGDITHQPWCSTPQPHPCSSLAGFTGATQRSHSHNAGVQLLSLLLPLPGSDTCPWPHWKAGKVPWGSTGNRSSTCGVGQDIPSSSLVLLLRTRPWSGTQPRGGSCTTEPAGPMPPTPAPGTDGPGSDGRRRLTRVPTGRPHALNSQAPVTVIVPAWAVATILHSRTWGPI